MKISRKISIIGAGSVGSTLAMRIVEDDLADVVLLDLYKNIAQAKAIDIMDAAPLLGHERRLVATDDYGNIRDSNIVVITAGLPRKPGMSREELIAKNSSIVKEVSENIKRYAPSATVIVVTNPLDAMTYLALKTTGFAREKVFGMAGALDTARFIAIAADELGVPRSSIEACVLGSHGDTMVPVLSRTTVNKKPIEKTFPKEKIEAIVKRARDRGAEVVSLLGTGSAYYSPSAAVWRMIKAVMGNTREILVSSVYLEGEYGLRDICIGVPCELGRGGIQKIIELKLTADEKKSLLESAEAIKKSIAAL